MGLLSEQVFSEMAKRVSANPATAKKVNAIFQFNITKGGKVQGTWTADLKGDSASVYEGAPKAGTPGCTMTMDDQDFVDMAAGKLNGQKAFLSGKLKVKGNIMLSQKLGGLLQEQSKL